MIQAIETEYNGYRFRSRTEARWAVFFDAAGIRYEYEKEGFELPCGRYLPDFFLPDINYWFEVKGQVPTADEIARCCFLYDGTEKPVFIAVGAPTPEFQLIHIPLLLSSGEFDQGYGPVTPRFMFADDRRNDNEFWLLADEYAHWLGPVEGPDHGRWPLVHSATKRGYEAARAARFEFDR
jgi:hypothetical protein